MSERFTQRPAQTDCKRCLELFVYFRTTRHRIYCAPCVELERKDAIDFYRDFRRQQGNSRRENN